jgi:hypothetical protein
VDLFDKINKRSCFFPTFTVCVVIFNLDKYGRKRKLKIFYGNFKNSNRPETNQGLIKFPKYLGFCLFRGKFLKSKSDTHHSCWGQKVLKMLNSCYV